VVLRVRLPGTVLLALAAVLAIGRVFMGLHYPSDVLAGAAVGAAAALVGWWRPIRARLDMVADAIGGAIDASLRRLAPG
jgi:undecaprenyl-diphosphatase